MVGELVNGGVRNLDVFSQAGDVLGHAIQITTIVGQHGCEQTICEGRGGERGRYAIVHADGDVCLTHHVNNHRDVKRQRVVTGYGVQYLKLQALNERMKVWGEVDTVSEGFHATQTYVVLAGQCLVSCLEGNLRQHQVQHESRHGVVEDGCSDRLGFGNRPSVPRMPYQWHRPS